MLPPHSGQRCFIFNFSGHHKRRRQILSVNWQHTSNLCPIWTTPYIKTWYIQYINFHMYHMQFDGRPAHTQRELGPFYLSGNQIGSKLESDRTDNTTRGANRWRGVSPELQSRGHTYDWLTTAATF